MDGLQGWAGSASGSCAQSAARASGDGRGLALEGKPERALTLELVHRWEGARGCEWARSGQPVEQQVSSWQQKFKAKCARVVWTVFLGTRCPAGLGLQSVSAWLPSWV